MARSGKSTRRRGGARRKQASSNRPPRIAPEARLTASPDAGGLIACPSRTAAALRPRRARPCARIGAARSQRASTPGVFEGSVNRWASSDLILRLATGRRPSARDSAGRSRGTDLVANIALKRKSGGLGRSECSLRGEACSLRDDHARSLRGEARSLRGLGPSRHGHHSEAQNTYLVAC
jgi:hypothetical protein